MGSVASVVAGQKMSIKEICSRYEFELENIETSNAQFDDDVNYFWCYKVTDRYFKKEGQEELKATKQLLNKSIQGETQGLGQSKEIHIKLFYLILFTDTCSRKIAQPSAAF